MEYKKQIIDDISSYFTKKFGEDGKSFFAPSRINIIGEHIDYNGGKVLPCAIEIGTYAMAKKNELGKIRGYSLNFDKGGEIDLDNLDYNKSLGWLNYIGGMAKGIKESGYNFSGFDIVIKGNIPTGSGLSSSASLEILIGHVINKLFKLKISGKDMSLLGMKTENDHLGLKTGIMDQFAISMGKKDSAILLDTSNLEYSYIDIDLKDNMLVILNTNKPRALVESKYNERRAETQKALSILRDYIKLENICQLSEMENWEDLLLNIEEPTIYKRARHAVEENIRVNEMVKAMKAEDFVKMGQLLNESHQSLKNFYEVTGKELDTIVEAARQVEGCFGARMTGAGFSGCAIALVKKSSLDELKEKVKKYYKEKTRLEAEIIISKIVDGPREL